MLSSTRSRVLFGLALLIVLAIVGVVVAAAAGAKGLAPLRLVTHYPWGTLAGEAAAIDGCVECHEPADMHTCATCHDEHGDAKMPGAPFNTLLLLTGDVPEAGYIPVNEILPYYEEPQGFVPLLDFLAQHEVTGFASVTLVATDGGFVTVERSYLTPDALLLPHADGVRFAAENLHISTWLKGITRIVVVGTETPLSIDGQATSIGRLLVGPTRSVAVDQTEVMLKSEEDGEIRRGQTALRLEGVALGDVVATPSFQNLLVRDAGGEEYTFSAEEARGALLAVVQSRVTLVLPERGRAFWVSDVVELITQK